MSIIIPWYNWIRLVKSIHCVNHCSICFVVTATLHGTSWWWREVACFLFRLRILARWCHLSWPISKMWGDSLVHKNVTFKFESKSSFTWLYFLIQHCVCHMEIMSRKVVVLVGNRLGTLVVKHWLLQSRKVLLCYSILVSAHGGRLYGTAYTLEDDLQGLSICCT